MQALSFPGTCSAEGRLPAVLVPVHVFCFSAFGKASDIWAVARRAVALLPTAGHQMLSAG